MELFVVLLLGVTVGLVIALGLARSPRVEVITMLPDETERARGGCLELVFGLLLFLGLLALFAQQGNY